MPKFAGRLLRQTSFATALPWPVILIGALGYFALARLGLSLASLQESASPVSPASGFALALLVIHGGRSFPAIALGAFAANVLTGGIATAIPITLGNTLEGLLSLWLYRHLIVIRPEQFPIARSAAIISGALVAPLASAGIGVASLTAAGTLDITRAADVLFTWWAGDTLGILLVTPFLLSWRQRRASQGHASPGHASPGHASPGHASLKGMDWLRALVLPVAAIAIAALAFLRPDWETAIFLALPLILLATRWFGGFGSSFVILVTAGAWLAGTLAELGPFTETTPNASLINMQIMLAALSAAGLILPEVLRLHFAAADLAYLLGGALAALIFLAVSRNNAAVDDRHFSSLIARISSNIEDRMGLYVSTLQGGASLYAASREVRRTEWHNYVDSLDIFERHPGITAIGIIVPADRSAQATFVANVKKDGFPDFTIKDVPGVSPADATYPQRFVVIYSEPAEENRAAVGIDIASEPQRRATALSARDSGQPAITPHIDLVQSNSPGFLLLVPMYREPLETLNATSRRWSFHGWVYAAFAADRFFGPSLSSEAHELHLRIYDGEATRDSDLIYDSAHPDDLRRVAGSFVQARETRLQLYGRTYTIRWQPTSHFEVQNRQAPILYSAGLVLFATLLTALIATLASQKDRANTIARRMNAALAASNERFSLAAACSRDGIWDYDAVADKTWSSPRYKEIYGYQESDFVDHWDFWRSIILPEDADRARAQFEEMMAGKRDGIDMIQRYRHRLGHIVHVHSRALPVRDAAGKVIRIIGVHTDISLVVKLEQQFKDAISVMRDGFGLFDADDRLILFNEGFIDEGTRKAIGDPTGCRFEEVVRAFVEHDMPDAKDPAFDREAWIAQRMERHRNPPLEPIEVKWGGDRWMRISERRTSDGGYVGIWSDVTEIKRLGQRLRDAIGALSDGFALFDAEDRLAICNAPYITKAVLEALGDPIGYTYEEIYRAYGRIDLGLTDPKALEEWLAGRVQRHQNPSAEPYEVTTSDGHIYRVLEQRTSDGGIVGTWTDVTTERLAQRRLQDAISSMADGFALFDADDRLVICNDAYMHSPSLRGIGSLPGLTMAEIIRRFAYGDPTDIRAKADPEGWIAERLQRHLNPQTEPYVQVLTDGRVLHISERRTSDGGIVGIWSDVTRLRVAERRLQDAVASINEGFVLLDKDMRYALFNDEFLRLYPKMAPHVAVGASFEDALRQGAVAGEYPDLTTPAEIDAFVAEWTARYRDPAAFQGEGAFADGRWVLIGHRGTGDGGCVNVYSNITALKQREADLAAAKGRLERQAEELIALTEELRNARRAAEAANVSKSHFLANMSHELRTPLNAILGFSEIIKTGLFGAISPPQYRDYAEDIYESGAHLLNLINDILDLSKIEADRMNLTVVPLETPALVNQAIRLVENLAEERHVALDASDIASCAVIHADERHARQILLNLLSNAVKFTPDGGTVTLRMRDEGSAGAAITVSDTGIGMTSAEIGRAMERFGQAEASYSKKVPGTGLGLPLVNGLAKLHGGSLTIESEKGVGTTVTVRLPWHDDLYHPRRQAAAS